MDAITPQKDRVQPHDDPHEEDEDQSDKTDDRDEGRSRKPKTSWGQYFRQRPWLVVTIAAVIIVLIVAGILWWLHARQFESTDDAFIDTRIVTISPQIAGSIGDVAVNDNQVVEAGAVLVRIDDSVYAAQLDQAKAQVDQAQASIANLDAQIDAQHARIDQANQQADQAKAALTFAHQEYARAQDLVKKGAGTVQQAQQTQSGLVQGQASYAGAEANAVAAQKQLLVLQTQREGAQAQLKIAQAQQKLAETNLSYTIITAPVAGRITKLTAAKGAYVAPGQALTMFVPRDIWITANFKETQLAYMKPGQPVDLSVDAFPNRTFHGRVDSIQAGSGTAFSLLPAENATGNYVKIVQRVPVKITFDQPPDVELGPGMSVVPAVKVR